jgi:hypothetical protein
MRAALIALALIVFVTGHLSAQSPTIRAEGNGLHVKAPDFHFIKGPVLNRLKEGRPVRLDFEVAVLSAPRGPIVAEARQSFNLSYDLWEERFAITRIGAASGKAEGSISHLTAADAEAWCLDHLPLSRASTVRGKPYWIRVQYLVADRDPAPNPEEGALTLQSLIAILSRRRQTDQQGDTLEAGPFRLD